MSKTDPTRQWYFEQIQRLEHPDLVAIDQAAIAKLQLAPESATLVARPAFPFGDVQPPVTAGKPVGDAVAAVHFLLAQTALQYRFWSMQGDRFVRYEFEGQVGSTGLIRAFSRAWGPHLQPGPALLAARDSDEGLRAAFGDIPDPASRRAILAEVLSSKAVILSDFLLSSIMTSGTVSVQRARLIGHALPKAYADPFQKKSMLLLGLVASWLRERMPVKDGLAAYADYQVPSVLRHFGVLRYSPALQAAIDARELIAPDSVAENAIRAGTVLACEQIAQHFSVTAAEVDWWCFTQRKTPTAPFHLCETTHY